MASYVYRSQIYEQEVAKRFGGQQLLSFSKE